MAIRNPRLIITVVQVWTDRKFGEVDYYVTQMLCGDVYFQKYLHKIGKVEELRYIYKRAG